VGRRLKVRTFLVGGPVRDLLLGRESPDIDLAVESRVSEFGAELARRLGGRLTLHSRFATGTVHLTGGRHVDIAGTRTESYAGPAALPKVQPARIEDDLVRRDFTINAIALEVTAGRFSRFVDPHSGRSDIARRVIRVLHARSFEDDPTRIFRCIRFAVRLGFGIEPETLSLMRAAVHSRAPALLSPERVLNEIRLICAEPLVLAMAEAVVREGVLRSALDWRPPARFLPQLARLAGAAASPWLLYVFWLSTLELTDRFPVTTDERASAAVIRHRVELRGRLRAAKRPSAVWQALAGVPEPALVVLALVEPSPVAAKVRRYLETYRHVSPALTGRDLRGLGVPAGPRIGRLLERLRSARLDGRIAEMSDEVRLVRRAVRAGEKS
jgi:tRNA nucleotidyltransferase (CCA-adding enzyme)